MKSRLYKFINFAFLLITISSINVASTLPLGNTVFWWAVNFFTIFLFIWARKYHRPEDISSGSIFTYYLWWNIICILRGCFVADNYWEWKNLVGITPVLLLPLSITVSSSPDLLQSLFKFWVRYVLPLFFLFFPFIYEREGVGYYLAPLTLFLLFFPGLKRSWKVILIFFCLFVFLGNLDARSNVIRFAVCLMLGLLFNFTQIANWKLLKYIRILLMPIPVILFGLAVAGVFNIFNMDEYVTGKYSTSVKDQGQSVEVSLTADTRTFLYKEVLTSAITYDYWLLGRTPARGNESESFGLFALEELGTGKMERFSNEVSVLNIFTWTGIVGLILYFLIFYKATYLAINKSNNGYIRIIGIYVCFRWCYAWVEEFNNFDLSNIFLWLMFGMCFSKAFRTMSDNEMENWVRNIFNIRLNERYQS